MLMTTKKKIQKQRKEGDYFKGWGGYDMINPQPFIYTQILEKFSMFLLLNL